ncbi:hypothetical protein TBLA_0H03160 [Henningerozyma blattae CBS 6284]|uniref:Sister chromatid cohesion protein n=1 Tax=Henningerozyma blattae (strain ATCC 34711 / CBS 6284 / DSM 70876 / NBRC 10599 / NRRL Y-10934 / UCD 77-7) TaxID=1071380 RepID=I2H895_HENB6|nr:hypothetical protein TBLA_0H03160 [Tetrapisispora blattae CBS 6284]CCH62597.1 hypothetical protein TBLA_0H03160 [Tetrapisispora blattae CBS 6284]
MTSSYPGENSDIGKTLVEGIDNQPLTYLVPKECLTKLINDPLKVSIPLATDVFENPTKEDLNIESYDDLKLGTADELNLEERIIYRRPRNIQMNENAAEGQFDMYDGLSPLALKFLKQNEPTLTSEDIQYSDYDNDPVSTNNVCISETNDDLHVSDPINGLARGKKRNASQLEHDESNEYVDSYQSLDLAGHETSNRFKIANNTNVSVTQATISKQYLKELHSILKILGKDEESSLKDNTEYWLNILHQDSNTNTYALTIKCLTKISLLIKNILKVQQIWDKISIKNLQRILDCLISNIEIADKILIPDIYKENTLKSSIQSEPSSDVYSDPDLESQSNLDMNMLKKIAYMSISLVFNIFLFDKNDKRLSLERYVSIPLEFLQATLDRFKICDIDDDELIVEIPMLQQSLEPLPLYIEKRPFLDEGLLSKLVYMFADVLMKNETELFTKWQPRHEWELIKKTVTNIYISLFVKIPNQRDFIIEELLNHLDQLPIKRLQKKLRRIEKNVFITDFTITIISMLENLNSYDFSHKTSSDNDDNLDEENLKLITNYSSEQSKSLQSIIFQITDIILAKMLDNPYKNKYILENYSTDLITLLPLPQWPIAEDLLSSLTKQMILEFNPSQHNTKNKANSTIIQGIYLQILGEIGSLMFKIKTKTDSKLSYNLTSLYNYPENLTAYSKSFKKCLNYIEAGSNSDFSMKYFWQKYANVLLKLGEISNEDNINQENSSLDLNSNNHEISSINKKLPTSFKKLIEELETDDFILMKPDAQIKTDSSEIEQEYFLMLQSFELLNLYEPYLKLIISALDKDKIKLRSIALKNLSMLTTIDESILATPLVKSTIQQRFNDSSALVKDSILDLVSIGKAPLYFYKSINQNFNDDSIMVRKHVLKLNEQIYDETSDLNVKIFIASKIIQKMEDEDDVVIESARNALFSRWIQKVNTTENIPEIQLQECNVIIDVIAGAIATNEKCLELFDWFLNFYLLNEEIHPVNEQNLITKSLNRLTDTLVQQITQLQSNDLDDSILLADRSNKLNLLTIFSDSISPFITRDHIIALYPYIVGEDRSTFQYYLLLIFNNTLKKLQNLRVNFLFDLETTVLSRLPRMTAQEIDQAMPLAWNIATQRRDYSRIAKACSSCLGHLSPYINIGTKTPKSLPIDGKLQRLLYLGTGFARFCEFNPETATLSYLQKNDSIYEYMAKCLLVFLQESIPLAIRKISIKNLTKLCSSHPRLFNSKHILKIFDSELKNKQAEHQLVILEGFYDFFLVEEKNSIRQTGVNTIYSSNTTIKRQTNTNKQLIHDGICSSLVSRYLPSILEISLLEDFQSSLIGLKLLKLILRYGYTTPTNCIPTIIAITGSTNDHIQKFALEILEDEFEKYETIVSNNISKGINLAIPYIKKQMGKNYFENSNFLRNLQHILGNHKKHYNSFLKRIVKLFNSFLNELYSGECSTVNEEIILFFCSNVSKLKFNTQYDLLTILKEMGYASEQIRSIILDQLRSSSEAVTLNIRNAIIVQMSLENVMDLLSKCYGIKEDVILISYGEESEMKERQLPENCWFNDKDAINTIKGLMNFCKKTDIGDYYCNKYKYVD